MKNLKHYQKELRLKGLIFHTTDDVFGKYARSKGFQAAYKEEMTRLNMVRRIRELRLAKRLTQKALAKKADMPQSVIARLESGEHSFSLGTLSRIAQVFDKEVELV